MKIRAGVSVSLLFIFAVGCASSAHKTASRSTASRGAGSPLAGTQIAITMDDLPGTMDPVGDKLGGPIDIGKKILAGFKEHSVPEVYGFTIGSSVRDNSDLGRVLDEWVQAGHPLGNHTFTHPDLDKITAKDYIENIHQNEEYLQRYSAAGMDWHYFRYPYLDEGEDAAKKLEVRKYLLKKGYKIAEVSIDFQDWAINESYVRCLSKGEKDDAEKVKDFYRKQAQKSIEVSIAYMQALFKRPVPLILLTHINRIESEMMSDFLKSLERQGVTFITLKQALSDPAYANEPAVPYPGDGQFFEQIIGAREEDPKDLGLKPFKDPADDPWLKAVCQDGPSNLN